MGPQVNKRRKKRQQEQALGWAWKPGGQRLAPRADAEERKECRLKRKREKVSARVDRALDRELLRDLRRRGVLND